MQQSLFSPEPTMETRLMEALQSAEQRWRTLAGTAVIAAGVGVLLGLVSLAVALLR
jgi:type IV secretory pathway TrbF-like protein